MPTVKVRNVKNEEVGEVELSDAVFGAPLNEGLIHAAVRNFMANARQGTSATKTRGDVSGAGRKLWKQKGTGRARIASLRSALERRRQRTRAAAARLVVQHAEENAPGRTAFSTLRARTRGQSDF